jgi:hypothetical protein
MNSSIAVRNNHIFSCLSSANSYWLDVKEAMTSHFLKLDASIKWIQVHCNTSSGKIPLLTYHWVRVSKWLHMSSSRTVPKFSGTYDESHPPASWDQGGMRLPAFPIVTFCTQNNPCSSQERWKNKAKKSCQWKVCCWSCTLDRTSGKKNSHQTHYNISNLIHWQKVNGSDM